MYEGGIRVPFAIVGPDIPKESLSRVPVTGLDIFPTMAQLANYSKPLPKNIDGGNLLPVLRNGAGNVERENPFLIFHHAVDRKAQSAIRLGDFKLVKTWKGKKLELFDLSKDLSEKRNLSAANPDKTSKLHSLMTNFLSDVGAETRQTED
jgi:arylsulfatase A-like enzyme